jgi:hypothetical protein
MRNRVREVRNIKASELRAKHFLMRLSIPPRAQ